MIVGWRSSVAAATIAAAVAEIAVANIAAITITVRQSYKWTATVLTKWRTATVLSGRSRAADLIADLIADRSRCQSVRRVKMNCRRAVSHKALRRFRHNRLPVKTW